MKRILGIFTFLFALSLAAMAQISVDAPSVVGLNEQFNITFTLNEKPSSFEWESGENFQLVWGPQTGSSTSISIVNGKHSKTSRYTYTYVVIPRQNGTFTMPAARAVIGGTEHYSKAPSVQVVSNGASQGGSSAASSSSSAAGGNSSSSQSSSSRASSSEDIFMRFSLSRTSAVVGEPITATLKLYTRGSVAGFEDAKFPSFNGFWAQEVESPQNITFQRESVGDKIYNSAVLRRWVIIPQKTGSINIDPAELVCLLQQRVSTGNSIFDGFFDDYQTVRKRVFSSAYTVKVSPLPEGAPASFTGAVGSYKISAKLSSDSLKVHDAASLMINISGKGNVALVSAPKVNFPPDSELYDVKTSDRSDKGSGGTSGSKNFEYPFIPRSYGDFQIPAIEFSYYDIQARKYVTLTTDALPYHVEKGAGADYVAPEGGINIPVNHRKDVKNLNDDIHYISTKMPKLQSEDSFLVGGGLFWGLMALVIIAALSVFGGVSYMRKLNGDVVKVRTRGASKAARKRLAMAENYLKKNLYSAYYEELHKALLGYASDKLNIGAADLSKESIAAAFRSAGASEDIVAQYVELVDQCEFARYAPASSNEAMKESFDKAGEVISALEDNMKGKAKTKLAAIAALLLMMPSALLDAQPVTYVDSLWNSAVACYADGQYLAAAQGFQSIASLGLSSPELYTNIANAHFKNQEYGQAILYYERALKLDPSNKDARYNLEIVRQMTLDKIESVPEFFLKTWTRKLGYSMSSNTWAVLALGLFALFAVLCLLFLLGRSSALRKVSFFSGIVVFLLFALALANAYSQKNAYESRNEAIVTRAVCAAKSSPSAVSGADLFVLHEGTKVRILDVVGDWTNISLADGREAWVLSNEITVI